MRYKNENNKNNLTILFLSVIIFQIFTIVNIHANSTFPVISNIHHSPINPKSEDIVTVTANITHIYMG